MEAFRMNKPKYDSNKTLLED
ncbi:hypothetical protein LCGC14_1641970, partial [marine sediment metagenome]